MLDENSARVLEESLLSAELRRSPQRFADLLAVDFLEFGSSGRVFDKGDVLAALPDLPDVVVPLEDFRIVFSNDSSALVTYRSTTLRHDGSTKVALRSSLWVCRDGHWQMRFHQGTPIRNHSGEPSG